MVHMAFITGVKMETKVDLYMPWQGLQILVLSWSRSPCIQGELTGKYFFHDNQAWSIGCQQSTSPDWMAGSEEEFTASR